MLKYNRLNLSGKIKTLTFALQKDDSNPAAKKL
jgi:hypothetical protein